MFILDALYAGIIADTIDINIILRLILTHIAGTILIISGYPVEDPGGGGIVIPEAFNVRIKIKPVITAVSTPIIPIIIY